MERPASVNPAGLKPSRVSCVKSLSEVFVSSHLGAGNEHRRRDNVLEPGGVFVVPSVV